jgi:transposase-like protein
MSYDIKKGQNMPRKRHTPEEIVAKQRQVGALVSQGSSVIDAVRQIGVTEVTCYRWRQAVWRPEAGPGEAVDGVGV